MKTNRRNNKVSEQTSPAQYPEGGHSRAQTSDYPLELSRQKMSEAGAHSPVIEPRPSPYRHWGINE